MKKLEGGFFEKNEIDAKREDVTVNNNVNKVVNNIKIKKDSGKEYTIPMTYRLKLSTIEQIDLQAAQAGMKISAYLQKVLDAVLDDIEVE
jgi:hypothetical protein